MISSAPEIKMAYFRYDFFHPEEGLEWLTYFVMASDIQTGLHTARRMAHAEGYSTIKLVRGLEITKQDFDEGRNNTQLHVHGYQEEPGDL